MDAIINVMKGSNIEGVGLYINENIIITCAHVVNTALNRHQNSQEKPTESDEIEIQFPYIRLAKHLKCKVIYWSPKPTKNPEDLDVAILEILGNTTISVQFQKYTLIEDYENRAIKVIGFPETYDKGVWVLGNIDGKISDGRYQVSGDINPYTLEVRPKFSGSPVIDKNTNEIIGILQSRREDIGKRIYYILPTEKILESYGEFVSYIQYTDSAIEKLRKVYIANNLYPKLPLSGLSLAFFLYKLENSHTKPISITNSSMPKHKLSFLVFGGRMVGKTSLIDWFRGLNSNDTKLQWSLKNSEPTPLPGSDGVDMYIGLGAREYNIAIPLDVADEPTEFKLWRTIYHESKASLNGLIFLLSHNDNTQIDNHVRAWNSMLEIIIHEIILEDNDTPSTLSNIKSLCILVNKSDLWEHEISTSDIIKKYYDTQIELTERIAKKYDWKLIIAGISLKNEKNVIKVMREFASDSTF